MNIIDYIDQYMEGRLSEADKLKFEALLAQDPEAQELVRNYSSVKELSNDILEQELLEQVNKKVYGDTSSEITEKPDNVRRMNPWIWRAAILAAACLVGFFLLQSISGKKEQEIKHKETLMAFYERPIDENKVRSADVNTMDLLAQGKYYFELNDFVKSEAALNSFIATQSEVLKLNEANYWLAHVRFNQDKYQAAGALFQQSEFENYQCYYALTQALLSKTDGTQLSNICK